MPESITSGCLDCGSVFDQYPGESTCPHCGSRRFKDVSDLLELARQAVQGLDSAYREIGEDWDD